MNTRQQSKFALIQNAKQSPLATWFLTVVHNINSGIAPILTPRSAISHTHFSFTTQKIKTLNKQCYINRCQKRCATSIRQMFYQNQQATVSGLNAEYSQLCLITYHKLIYSSLSCTSCCTVLNLAKMLQWHASVCSQS